MTRLLTLLLALALFSLTAAPHVLADCVPIYGGGSTCTNTALTVSKSVFDPSTNSYVHDLGITDPKFQPGDTLTFHITVTNTGNQTARAVTAYDVVPQFIATTNPAINDGGGTTIAMPIGDLAPGESKTQTVTQQLGPAANFPSNQSVTCLNNEAEVKDSEGDYSQDFSQFCVAVNATSTGFTTPTPEPTVYPSTPTTTLPPTGADPLSMAIPFSAGGIGLTLRYLEQKFFKRKQ